MTVSPKMRIVALAGLALILAALGLKLTVLSRPAPPVAIRYVPPAHHGAVAAVHHRGQPAPRRVDPTLPAPLRRALARHGVVVAVLYAPVPGDGRAVQAARQGAARAHAGFAVLNVRNEAVAAAAAAKLPGSSDPTVLVVRRPGTIAFVLSGSPDAPVVAQAAREAGR